MSSSCWTIDGGDCRELEAAAPPRGGGDGAVAGVITLAGRPGSSVAESYPSEGARLRERARRGDTVGLDPACSRAERRLASAARESDPTEDMETGYRRTRSAPD